MIGLWLITAKIELLVVIFLDTFTLYYLLFFVFVSTIWLDIGQCGVLLGVMQCFAINLGFLGPLSHLQCRFEFRV